MSESAVEHVLVVPTEVFRRMGYFQGFTREVDRYLPELLDPAHVMFRPRDQVEEDPELKQLIPYVIFLHRDADGRETVFQYTRGKGQGEGRLHHLRSVGIGGHISSTDLNGTAGDNPFQEGMRRELDEEVAIETPYQAQCVGLINDDETPVGRVHLGLVHLFEVERPEVHPRETDIMEAGFRPIERIMADLDHFETWAQITMRALFGS